MNNSKNPLVQQGEEELYSTIGSIIISELSKRRLKYTDFVN